MLTETEATREAQYSSYLEYLPSLYKSDDFTGRYLCIFEDILKPIEGIIDNLSFYFDPGTAPSSFLPWLTSWVGIMLDERWPEEKQHELIQSAAELYRWRGTKKGLSEYIKIYTGVLPQIIEHTYTPGMQLGSGIQLGDTQLGEGKGQPYCFTVILNIPKASTIDIDIVRAIIEMEKPAHTTYILQISN